MISDRFNKWIIGLILVLMGIFTFWRMAGWMCSEHVGQAVARAPQGQKVKPVRPSHSVETAALVASSDAPLLPRQVAEQGPKEAAAVDVVKDNGALQAWADGVGVDDMVAALKRLQDEEPNELGRALTVQLIRRWAEKDVATAAAWAVQMPSGETRQVALGAVAIMWADQDPGRAIEWVNQWSADTERQSGLLNIAYETARTDPELALGLAIGQPVLPEWDELIRHAAMQWAASAPEAASAWVQQNIDGPLRAQVLARVAMAWGETDPVAAATLALEAIPPGRLQENAVMGIVQRWVQKDPETTAAWVARFPDDSFKQTALENLVKLWADKDAQQVATWLNSMTNGFTREEAVVAFTGWLSPASPAVAAQWAESLAGESERQRQMELVGRNWLETDGPAARAWIAQVSLPEPAKRRLLGSTYAISEHATLFP